MDNLADRTWENHQQYQPSNVVGTEEHRHHCQMSLPGLYAQIGTGTIIMMRIFHWAQYKVTLLLNLIRLLHHSNQVLTLVQHLHTVLMRPHNYIYGTLLPSMLMESNIDTMVELG